MAILITGQKGFIGSHLTSFLKKRGYSVILFEGDISDKESTNNFKIREKIDIVIHLAGVINKKKKDIFTKVNVGGAENIVELCRKLKARRIIFLSTIRVLSSFSNPYVNSKRKAEEIIINSGLPYIILRPAMVYGPGDLKNIGLFIRLSRFIPLMPMFDFRMQPIFIDDILKIIAACIDFPANAVLNITGPEIISFRDLLARLKSFGYKFYTVNMPSFFSFVIKTFSLLPFSPVPHWQIRGLLSDEIYQGSNWENLFHIEPVLFKDGLSKIIKPIGAK